MPKRSKAQRRAIIERAKGRKLHFEGEFFEFEAPGTPEIVEAEDGEELQAPCPRFQMNAYNGGPMDVGFEFPVVVQLSGMRIGSTQTPILRNHNMDRVVGHATAINKTNKSLRLSGVVSGAGPDASEVVEASQNGFRWQASIGAGIRQLSFVDDQEKITVNGRDFTGPLLVARGTVLREVSFVAVGADSSTSVRVAASIGDSQMSFEQWLEARGFTLEDLSDEQKTSLRAMYDAELAASQADDQTTATNTDESTASDTREVQADGGATTVLVDTEAALEAQRQAQANERRRLSQLSTLSAQYRDRVDNVDGMEADAIEAGWSGERYELELHRNVRASAPAVHTNRTMVSTEALQGALLLRAGCDLNNEVFRSQQAVAMNLPSWLRAGVNDDQLQQVMEAGHRLSEASMVDLCRYSLMAAGQDVPISRSEMIQASFSGGSLTHIFTSNISTLVLAAYQEVGDSTQGWTSSQDVLNFKINERPRLVTGEGLAKHPRGGEAEHWSRDDVGEQYRIARYSRQMVIDEQDVVDDNFSALSSIPGDMGRAAGRLRPDLVYSILYANAALSDGNALFDAANHNNLQTGANLADGTLRAAITSMAIQTENGVNLNIPPTHLIVSKGDLHQARQLVRSIELRGQASQDGTRNPLIDDNLEIRSDSRLDNGVIDPDSGTVHTGAPTDWYLASSEGHTIEVGYLAGTGRAPQVRTGRLDKGAFGMWVDCKLDIGAKALDFRALNKAEGT